MTISRTLLVGIVQLALATVLGIIALDILWTSWSRWNGISHLTAARLAMVVGQDSERAKREAVAAASALPHDAATVLSSLDFEQPDMDQRLTSLASRCDSGDRPLVEVAQALTHILHDQPAETLPGSDGALLAAMALVKSGAPVPEVAFPADAEAPHLAVLEAYYLQQWRSALAHRLSEPARAAAGALALLMPSSPDAPLLNIAAALLHSGEIDTKTVQALLPQVKDRSHLLGFAQDLGHLAPERALAMKSLLFGLPPTATAEQVLGEEVTAASGNLGLSVEDAVADCLAAGHPEAAAPLMGKLSSEMQEALQRSIRSQQGDLVQLMTLGASDPSLTPTCSTPRIHAGLICFQLSNKLGMLPRSNVVIKLDGKVVPATSVQHAGSLIGISTKKEGEVKLEVLAGTHTIYTGTVTL